MAKRFIAGQDPTAKGSPSSAQISHTQDPASKFRLCHHQVMLVRRERSAQQFSQAPSPTPSANPHKFQGAVCACAICAAIMSSSLGWREVLSSSGPHGMEAQAHLTPSPTQVSGSSLRLCHHHVKQHSGHDQTGKLLRLCNLQPNDAIICHCSVLNVGSMLW